MQFEALYLIKPRPTLRDQLRGRVEDDFAELLLEPVLLSNKEGGCSAWGDEDHALTIKLMHLAQVREYTPVANDEDFDRVFGSPCLSVGLFDRWWTIRRLMRDDDTESMRPLLRQFLPIVHRTGNKLVDQWLDWVRDHEEQPRLTNG